MKRMHKNCAETFSGFCRKPVPISESVWTTCCEINDLEPHTFPIFLIFSTQADNDNGLEGGGVAKDAGRKEVEQ